MDQKGERPLPFVYQSHVLDVRYPISFLTPSTQQSGFVKRQEGQSGLMFPRPVSNCERCHRAAVATRYESGCIREWGSHDDDGGWSRTSQSSPLFHGFAMRGTVSAAWENASIKERCNR
jgi:hypothetical protein